MGITIHNILKNDKEYSLVELNHSQEKLIAKVWNKDGRLKEKVGHENLIVEINYEQLINIKILENYDDFDSKISQKETNYLIKGRISQIIKTENDVWIDLYLQTGPEFITILKSQIGELEIQIDQGVEIEVTNLKFYPTYKSKRMSFLTAEWRKLIMANYEIDPAILKPYLPAFTELDFFEGKTYVSLVGFLFDNTKLKGLSIPFHKTFEEVNLRFYVRHFDGKEWKRGTVFISEIVPKPAIAFVANTLYKEHYSTMRMRYEWAYTEGAIDVSYEWRHKKQWNKLAVTAEDQLIPIPKGSFEEFITEHYWGYNRISNKQTTEYEVRHSRWDQYSLKSYNIEADFESLYGSDFKFLQLAKPHNVLLAEGSAISVEGKRSIQKLFQEKT